MQLQILYHGFHKEATMKKINSKLKITKFFIVCQIY